MKILIALTYYRPHISGLTIYAERIAKAFARRGHEVTVLTSRYDKALPREEVQDGVRIVRAPIWFRLSKGVIMPSFYFLAAKLARENDAVQIHLPQFESAWMAFLGRILRKPTVITYHCDLLMPPGLLNWVANQAVCLMNIFAAIFTHRIVTYTEDYAKHSRFLASYKRKSSYILPPVELPEVTDEEIQRFRQDFNPDNRKPVIGMAARLATEKGVEVLLEALPSVIRVFPKALVLFAGPYQNIVGEQEYYQRLMPLIQRYEVNGHWRFVGTLNPRQMATFYPNLDVLVLPSLNSTEAFGLVQIEAMINGVPVIASDLPGVRQPVIMHEMGRIIPIGNSAALSAALIDILQGGKQDSTKCIEIARRYMSDTVAQAYEQLFADCKIS
ncbi:MAG: glycosyltransferase family 4 protein [Anaerolineae bacterium]|nr:glycosyltransferase family 4 protein [Anaerolineae bacterium]